MSRPLLSIVPDPTRRGGAHRTLVVGATEKRCPTCGIVKPADTFGRNKHARDGLTSNCLQCRRAQSRARDKDNPDIRYGKHLRKRYGMSLAEYQRMLREQNGVCAVCRGTRGDDGRRALHVDHDHVTGAIRSLLCKWCNASLGHAQDDPMLLRALADYIERHK